MMYFKTSATGKKSGFGLTCMLRFWKLWQIGFPSCCGFASLRLYAIIALNAISAAALLVLNVSAHNG